MSIQLDKFVRKPFFVSGVKVTEENLDEVAKWCGGVVVEEPNKTKGRHIKVPVRSPQSDRQTKAFPGDWVVVTNRASSYKVYTENALNRTFQAVAEEAKK